MLKTPSGRVHWIGTGMSTGSGLGLVAGSATETLVWGRSEDKAKACLKRLGIAGPIGTRALTPEALAAEVHDGDLVVSMLPATEHPAVLRLCLANSAHFASSSYVSEEVATLAGVAAKAGLVVLTEAGLDPGIDHLLAHRLVESARDALGAHAPARVSFTSYCGSFPAVPNEFRYRFSWAPRGVLTALRTPARYIEDGDEHTSERPYRSVRDVTLGGERFEVYPNRDSVPFVATYGFPASWTVDSFVRGTVRLEGWTDAWQAVFAAVEDGTDEDVARLAGQLAAKYPATSDDHDRVVMFVTLTAVANGIRWTGEYTMDVCGDERENATPRLVSVALAGGIAQILAGQTAPGLHRASADPAAIQRWLDFLTSHGVTWNSGKPVVEDNAARS